jgi:hypothetical protein
MDNVGYWIGNDGRRKKMSDSQDETTHGGAALSGS